MLSIVPQVVIVLLGQFLQLLVQREHSSLNTGHIPLLIAGLVLLVHSALAVKVVPIIALMANMVFVSEGKCHRAVNHAMLAGFAPVQV